MGSHAAWPIRPMNRQTCPTDDTMLYPALCFQFSTPCCIVVKIFAGMVDCALNPTLLLSAWGCWVAVLP